MKLTSRIKNVLYWLPIIWSDYHWDYASLYPVLRRKLEAMEDAIRNGMSVDADHDADRIHYVVLLLKRLEADEYLIRALEPVEKQWGETDMVTERQEDGMCRLVGWKHEKATNEAEAEQADREWREAGTRSDTQQDQDWREVWATIAKYGRSWWD